MNRIAAMFVLLAAFALPARALAPPATIETNWKWNMVYKAFTGVTSGTLDVAGLGGTGYSTTGGNKVGFSFSVLSVGDNSNFTISQTTQPFPAPLAHSTSGFNAPAPSNWNQKIALISTTSVITAVNNVPMNQDFQAITWNPVFTFSGLNAAATTYIWCSFADQNLNQ